MILEVKTEDGGGKVKVYNEDTLLIDGSGTKEWELSNDFRMEDVPSPLRVIGKTASAEEDDVEILYKFKWGTEEWTEASEKLTVVEIESILPDIGQEIDDDDGDDETKVFVVSVTNTSDVTVTATLNPEIEEADLPSGWTINGGTGEGKLERTVSTASASKTELTFNCGCTDSGLETTVYVYDAKIGLYADKGSGGSLGDKEWGHSWWKISCDENIKFFIQDVNPDLNDDKFFGKGGWWPDDSSLPPGEEWNPLFPIDGQVKYDNEASGSHTATGSKEWAIAYDSLVGALSYVKELDGTTDDFDAKFNNCTDQAVKVGNAADISTISTTGVTTPEDLSDWLNAN